MGEQQRVVVRSYFDRALYAPETLYDVILLGIIPTLAGTGHLRYCPPPMFAALAEHVEWARRTNRPFVACIVFFGLYCHYAEVQELVHAVERRVRPHTSQESIVELYAFVRATYNDAQMTGYTPDNASTLLHALHRALLIGVGARPSSVLRFPGFNDKELIDTLDHKKACSGLGLESYQNARARADELQMSLDNVAKLEPGNPQRARLLSEAEQLFPILTHIHVVHE